MFANGIEIPLFNNSHGKKDGVWTLVVGTWFIVALQTLLAGSAVNGMVQGMEVHLSVPEADTGIVTALISLLTAYVARRNGVLAKSVAPKGEVD